MGSKSGIRWTTSTWNPITGCSKVSPGCAHCYAETLALTRLAGKPGYPGLPWTPENAAANVTLRPDRLSLPLRWPDPRRIFVNSMSDLFHELAPLDYVARVFAVMARAERHTFQVLTKRPERMAAMTSSTMFRDAVERHYLDATDVPRGRRGSDPAPLLLPTYPLPNVWLGTSIENDRWTVRADDLRATRAAVRFISAEPLLGPLPSLDLTSIDWLIVGGESGADFRTMDPAWARDLRDRCTAAGVAFYFKQSSARFTEQGQELDGRRWEQFPDDDDQDPDR